MNWWNSSWNLRKEITTHNGIPGFQMELTVFKENGHDNITNSIIDCEGGCNNDFSDLRFIDGDNNTLPYWIAAIDTANRYHYATIWINTSGSNTIYMYYGNEDASPVSNGDNVWYWYDDFNDGIITGWSTSYSNGGQGGISESGGLLDLWSNGNSITGERYAKIYSQTSFTTGTKLIGRISSNEDWHKSWDKRFGFGEGNNFGDSYGSYVHHATSASQWRCKNSNITSKSFSGNIRSLTKVEIHRINSSSYMFREKGQVDKYITSNIPNQDCKVFASVRDDADCGAMHLYLDYIAVGKTCESESIWTSFGKEEENPYRIYYSPCVDFTYNPSNPTDLQTITFSDISTDPDGAIISWNWSFGDGEYAFQQNVNHRYANNGRYTVTLNVTDDNGYCNETSKQINVSNISPEAGFTYYPLNPTVSDNVLFNDTSSDADGIIVNWTWNFGDGEKGYNQNETHQYTNNGSYTLNLTVKDDDGETNTYMTIVNVKDEVGENNISPTANFSWSANGLTVSFTDLSSDTDGSITSRNWEFGDESSSTQQNPSHTYERAGIYFVTLSVIDNNGANDSYVSSVVVSDEHENVTIFYPTDDTYIKKDVASYNYGSSEKIYVRNTYGTSGSSVWGWDTLVRFDISSMLSGKTISSAKLNLYYCDNWDDDPTHRNLNIYRIANNWDENTATWNNQPSYASQKTTRSSVPSSMGVWMEWDVTSDVQNFVDDQVINYGWKITDENFWGGINIPTIIFNSKESTYSHLIPYLDVRYYEEGVENVPPVADFSWSANGVIVEFEDKSTDSDGNIVSWNWEFGDESSSTQKNPTHIYTSDGTYLITLNVTDNDGEFDSKTRSVTIVKGTIIHVYVDDDYDNYTSGWGVSHFDNIQDAINNIFDGGTIHINNSVYYENVVVNKSVSLLGQSNINTIIDCNGDGDVVTIVSDDCTIQNIKIRNSGNYAGVKILSNGNILTDNLIKENYYGIWINGTSDNTISNNIFSLNKGGIRVRDAHNTIISGNQISYGSLEGITLESSYNTNILDNIMENNGITISGPVSTWNSHVIKDNTVDDGEIYYYKNIRGVTVPYNAAQVILANCTNFIIKNQYFADVEIGIQLGYSSDIRIERCTFDDLSQSAIQLYCSDENTIIQNTIDGGNGIDFWESKNNNIWENTITNTNLALNIYHSQNNVIKSNYIIDNVFGIWLHSYCIENIIDKNTISSNTFGGLWFMVGCRDNIISNNIIDSNGENSPRNANIYLMGGCTDNTFVDNTISSNGKTGIYIEFDVLQNCNNHIYHNNFINNARQAYDKNVDIWDDGYPSGGNYWSDYTECDADGDGIGDTPYNIPGGNSQDRYPFMDKWGWNDPPSVPSNPSPSNQKTNVNINTIIGWSCSDPENDTVIYDIYFGTNTLPPKIKSGHSSTSYYPGPLDYDTTYYWKIVAIDSIHSRSTDGPVWSLTTQNRPPTANFTWSPNSPDKYEQIQFIDTSVDVGGNIVEWYWDFGDGTTSTGQNPTHSYSNDGAYNVYLLVTDDDGATNFITKSITVDIIEPSAGFTYTPSDPNKYDNIQFTDISTDSDGTIVSWYWTFGDGSTSNAKNPTHQYRNIGTYTASLRITDNDGGQDTISKQIVIEPDTIYTEDFEDGIGPEWYTYVSNAFYGTNTRYDGDSNSGTHSWKMDTSKTGEWCLNELILKLELNDANYLELNFNTLERGDEQHTLPDSYTGHYSGDGISVSTDGTNWIGVWDYPYYVFGWTQYGPISIGDHISLDNDIYIKFQQYDNFIFPADGILWDDISLASDGIITLPEDTLNDPPSASFTYSPEKPETTDIIQFTDASVDTKGAITNWYWNFGDGSTSTEQNPTHQYRNNWVYTVSLTVVDSYGARDTETINLQVGNIDPVASASFLPSNPSFRDTIYFIDKSTDSDGTIVSWYWTFGDGSTSTEQNPTHKYATARCYTATLTVTDNRGGTDSEIIYVVTYPNNRPNANAGGPYSGRIGDVITFDGSGSSDSDGSIVGYRWDFENDGTYDTAWLTTPTTTHSYSSNRIYPIRLQVKDNDGDISSARSYVVVSQNYLPVVIPGGPYYGKVDYSITFDGSGSRDYDGSIVGYRWDFENDGVYDTSWSMDPTSNHTYTLEGIYYAKLECKDNEGASNSNLAYVRITSNRAPYANAGSTYYGKVESSVTFDGSSSFDTDGSIVGYRWDFGGDGNYDTSWSTSPTTTNSYNYAGVYAIVLQVKDNDGSLDTDNAAVVISKNNPPVANAGGPYSGRIDNLIILDGSNSYDPDGSISGYKWDFGDGTYDTSWSTTSSTAHTYSSKGTYTVRLQIKDDEGAISADTATVTISPNNPPNADAGGPYEGFVNAPITFDGSGSNDPDGSISGYRWDFNNDGEYDTDWIITAPSYVYSSTGTFILKLEVKDNEGSTNADTSTVTIRTNNPPVVDAGGPYSGFVDEDIRFIGSNSYDPDGSIVGYRWDFENDGIFDTSWSTTSIVATSYSIAGTYTVKLEVKDNDGFTDTGTSTVKITDSYLRGLWHLDEGYGSIAYDSSEDGNNGEINGALWAGTGKYGNSLRFHGDADFVRINGISKSYDDFTISLWANFNNLIGDRPLISRQDGTGVGRDILVLENSQIKTYIGGNSTSSDYFPDALSWHHYALTYNNGLLKIYVDGKLRITDNVTEEHATGAYILGSNKEMIDFFDGEIDEIAIWSKSLSTYEIQNLYTVPNQPTFETPANKTEWVDSDIGKLSCIVSEPYTFEKPETEIIDIGGTQYHRVTQEGCDIYGEPGEPKLPVRGSYILLPKGTTADNIKIITSERQYLGNGINVEPGTLPAQVDSDEEILPEPNEKIYSSNDMFPGKLFTEVGTFRFRGYDILVVMLHPVQYVPASGEVYYYDEMLVTVETSADDGTNTMYRGLDIDALSMMDMVDNPGVSYTYSSGSGQSSLQGNYDMVIITTDTFMGAFEPLKQAHASEGLRVLIYSVEDIYDEYSGVDNQQKIRNFIRDAYINLGIEYVLLGGDTNVVPIRKLYVHSWCGGYQSNMPSDLYYSCLDGTFNYDGDAYWGEAYWGDSAYYGLGTDGDDGGEMDLFADVYVGRASAGSIQEVNNFVIKTIGYMYTEDDDPYLKDVLLVGEHLGFGGVAEYAANAMNELIDGSSSSDYTTVGIPSDEYNIDTLYDQDGSWSRSQIESRINNGVHIINHLGHANYHYNMKMYTYQADANLNNDQYCFIYSQGCMAGGFDANDCIAEHLTVKTEHGAFAGIWNARYGWGRWHSTDGPSQRFDREFWDAVFGEDKSELGKANADSKEDNLYRIREACMRWCYYELNLFGDPSLDLRRLEDKDQGSSEEPTGDMDVKFYWGDGTLIGVDENVANNSAASVDIDTLTRYTNVSWYVVIDDNFNEITGPVWWFTVEAYDWDINRDGRVDDIDSELLISRYGETGKPGWIREDIIRDGRINIQDISTFVNHYGESYILEFEQASGGHTLTVTSIYLDNIKWDDLEIIGDANTNGLAGNIRVGDQITSCSGTLTITYKPTRTVSWTWIFAGGSESPPAATSNPSEENPPDMSSECDVNGDGIVDDADMDLVTEQYGETGEPGWIPADINEDGIVDYSDISTLVLDIEESDDGSNEDTSSENENNDENVNNGLGQPTTLLFSLLNNQAEQSSSSTTNDETDEQSTSTTDDVESEELDEIEYVPPEEEEETIEEEIINEDMEESDEYKNINDLLLNEKVKIKPVRSITIEKAPSSLISIDDDSIPEYIKDDEVGDLIPVTYAPGEIKKVEEDKDKGDVIVTVGVQKADWIYIEIADNYPDNDVTVKTLDGRVILDDMIWRESGKIYVLDDPDVVYQFIYHEASANLDVAPEQGTFDEEIHWAAWIAITAAIIIFIGVVFVIYKKKHEQSSKTSQIDKMLKETDDFLHAFDKKYATKKNTYPGSKEKQYRLLKMMCSENADVETITSKIGISMDELESLVDKLVRNGFLQFISDDEVEMTDKGINCLKQKNA